MSQKKAYEAEYKAQRSAYYRRKIEDIKGVYQTGRKAPSFRPGRMSTLVLFFRYAPNDARHKLTLHFIRPFQFAFFVSGFIGFHQCHTL